MPPGSLGSDVAAGSGNVGVAAAASLVATEVGHAGDSPRAAPGAPGGAARRTRRDRGARGGLASLLGFLPIAFLAVFGGIPIILSLLLMLGHLGGPNSAVSELGQNEIPGRGLGTLGAITQMFEQRTFWDDIWATVIVFVVSSAIVLVVAATLTIWHRLRPSRPLAVLQFLAVVPLFIPVVIASFALWTFWGDRGFTNSVAQLLGISNALILSGRLQGVVLAEVWVSLPLAVLLMRAAVSTLGDSSLDAARDAGAGPVRVGWRIVLPQLRRECAIVYCFTAVGALGSFTVPYIVGPSSPLLLGVDAVDTFSEYNEPQQAAVIGFTIFVIAALIGCLYAIGSRRRRVRAR
ncbi:MAG TPA: ABC transporter permease subunit [Acidimicrobiales bacterium]|nr:ABC transporter permease subunit [Acidimicrobiales bacterium]